MKRQVKLHSVFYRAFCKWDSMVKTIALGAAFTAGLAMAVDSIACFWTAVLSPAHAIEGGPLAPHPYGLIEIGSKGVKAYVFDLDKAESDPSCSEENDAYLKCLNEQTLPQANVNALEEQQIGKAAKAVKDFYEKFTTTYRIPPERIFIVGSSGIIKSDHKDTLVAAIKAALGPHSEHEVDFVTVDQEATYSFEGVLGMLPHRWRKLRQHQAAVIDIGSGNLKASFLANDSSERKIVTFGVDAGTKRATDEINKLRGSLEFPQAADKWRAVSFVPNLRTQLDNNPGLDTRNRVYLVGGIVWAMVNLTRPDDKSKFPPIKPISIDKFLAAVSAPDGASKLCSDDNKEKYKDVGKACETFSANNLISGTEILKGLSDELRFVKGKKNLFFFRDSLYAWPLGYIRNKVYGAENP